MRNLSLRLPQSTPFRSIAAIRGQRSSAIQNRRSVRCSATAMTEKGSTSTVLKVFQDLQQGSDVRGIAMEGIVDEPVTLTPIRLYFISVGFGKWLSQKLGKPADTLRISIGRDPRISGKTFQTRQTRKPLSGALVRSAVTVGLASIGVSVSDFGLASTPAMFMSCILEDYSFDGAIMLTASHLPFNRNGMKFFDKTGGLDKPDIKQILQLAAETCIEAGVDPNNDLNGTSFLLDQATITSPSKVSALDFMPVYSAHLRTIIQGAIGSDDSTPLKGFKIAVDAGNGSGGFVAADVLAPLGADVSGSQFLEPDGWFPNHIPNPEDAEAAASATEAVLRSKSDLGVIYDTDVDRSGVVDASGVSINSNRMIALMSAIVLREHPGTTIVTDSVTSNGLKQFIESKGGRHFRYKRGYKNVIGKGMELNQNGVDCELMMETSGHGALKENYFLDDGAYMSLKIVVEMVRRRKQGEGSIADLIGTLQEPLEAKEFRIKIQGPNFKEIATDATQRFHDFVISGAVQRWKMEDENYEGWRVIVDEENGKKGWCLLRPSIHDPLCVLNIESEVPQGLKTTATEILSFFEQHCSDLALDLSSLHSVVSQ